MVVKHELSTRCLDESREVWVTLCRLRNVRTTLISLVSSRIDLSDHPIHQGGSVGSKPKVVRRELQGDEWEVLCCDAKRCAALSRQPDKKGAGTHAGLGNLGTGPTAISVAACERILVYRTQYRLNAAVPVPELEKDHKPGPR